MSTSFSSIRLDNLNVDFDGRFQLNDINWHIDTGQNWMIVGANGSGKSALAAVLAGIGSIESGSIQGLPSNVGLVSFAAQAELIADELKKDDADIMDVVSLGTPVHQILSNVCVDHSLKDLLVQQFGLAPLLNRAFRKLSTGETRKVMLIRALACEPDLLVLDEPFDGLDSASLAMLQEYLRGLAAKVPMVLVLNRWDECPDFISDIAYVEQGELKLTVKAVSKAGSKVGKKPGDKEHSNAGDQQAYNELYQLLHLKTTELMVPAADPASTLPHLDPLQPLVRLSNVGIKYADEAIFSDLNWTIQPQQHWQLSGPNGSGKTGLLALITGDHPQCYSNDIFVFGFQRGSGESIWQIKQFIGYVSTALQWEYRVSASLRNVIISGFYDSIGLYSKCTETERDIANQWLALLGMSERADQPFNKLSFGDQRLLLIARAMVKHPALLILDEPCLGLDELNRQLVLALIEKICADSRSSVIYVNHHPEDKILGIDNYLSL